MNVKPILFSGPMVRAIIDGRKTQTRRVIKPHPYNSDGDTVNIQIAKSARFTRGADGRYYYSFEHPGGGPLTAYVAGFVPGDLLWVREAITRFDRGSCDQWAWYRAGRNDVGGNLTCNNGWVGRNFPNQSADAEWQAPAGPAGGKPYNVSSNHMPRWASRLALEVTDVRVQRLQDISEEDARAEGCPFTHDGHQYEPPPPEIDSWQGYGRASFSLLWSKINGPGSWSANPWIVAVSFIAHQQNIDAFLAAREA